MSPDERIMLAHGGGGLLSRQLVERVFMRALGNAALDALEDASDVPSLAPGEHMVMSTDAFVVQPLFFPGGDIGKLAVCGTVNDLAMRGARPLALCAAFVLEEGLPIATLERVVDSMAEAARQAGVRIVAGDTKVVERGKADSLFVATSGVGAVPAGVAISARSAQVGDVVIVSGAMGDHGITILTQRQGLRLTGALQSDCAPLNGLVRACLDTGAHIRTLRDATRGGLAAVLNEIALQSNVGIEIEEEAIPVHEAVRSACELLGLDPLQVANEGKLVAFVAHQDAAKLLEAMRSHPLGQEAQVIGRVQSEHATRVVCRTLLGARRWVDLPAGELLPRIC